MAKFYVHNGTKWFEIFAYRFFLERLSAVLRSVLSSQDTTCWFTYFDDSRMIYTYICTVKIAYNHLLRVFTFEYKPSQKVIDSDVLYVYRTLVARELSRLWQGASCSSSRGHTQLAQYLLYECRAANYRQTVS